MHREKEGTRKNALATTSTALPSQRIVCNELTTDFNWCWATTLLPTPHFVSDCLESRHSIAVPDGESRPIPSGNVPSDGSSMRNCVSRGTG